MDAGLGLPLALLIGQQRDRIVFEDGSNKHVKLVGMLYDYVSGGVRGWNWGCGLSWVVLCAGHGDRVSLGWHWMQVCEKRMRC